MQIQVNSVSANVEEAVRLAKRFNSKPDPTLERTIVRSAGRRAGPLERGRAPPAA